MWADEPELVPSAVPVNMPDGDTDMMDTSEPTPQSHATSGSFHSVVNATGRIPTPIHCSFAAQVRGAGWNGRAVAMSGDALATTPEEPTGEFGGNGMMDSTPVAADWTSMAENRRLPSPISECGPEDSAATIPFNSAPPPPFSHIGSRRGSSLDQVTHDHPLVAELPARTSSALSFRSGTSDKHGRSGSGGSTGSMDVESPPRRGHTRSKHTLNSWTAMQPGMTRTFSIGYRADCEKCRMKQPGHFNHIIIS
jgi:hypothetical protein